MVGYKKNIQKRLSLSKVRLHGQFTHIKYQRICEFIIKILRESGENYLYASDKTEKQCSSDPQAALH